MNTEKFIVNVPQDYDGKPIKIEFLEGKAAEPLRTNNPKKLVIDGFIDTPSGFLLPRMGNTLSPNDHVQFSKNPDNVFIKLLLDPMNELGTVVVGKLTKNKDLKEFRFNQAKVFDNASFSETILKFAHCFENLEEAKALRRSLLNFTAKFDTEVENLDDKKGNTSNAVRTILNATKAGIPDNVRFKMPFFEGGPLVSFVAEVEIDVVMEKNVPEARFGFFSMEFETLMRFAADEIVESELEKLRPVITCLQVG